MSNSWLASPLVYLTGISRFSWPKQDCGFYPHPILENNIPHSAHLIIISKYLVSSISNLTTAITLVWAIVISPEWLPSSHLFQFLTPYMQQQLQCSPYSPQHVIPALKSLQCLLRFLEQDPNSFLRASNIPHNLCPACSLVSFSPSVHHVHEPTLRSASGTHQLVLFLGLMCSLCTQCTARSSPGHSIWSLLSQPEYWLLKGSLPPPTFCSRSPSTR